MWEKNIAVASGEGAYYGITWDYVCETFENYKAL